MSLYTKARKYIDMDRVKELREDKIERKKIADEIREKIREELSNINSPYFSNWRYDLGEAMTTSSFMSTTLLPTGDVDLVNVDVSNADTWTGTTNAGTVSASGLSFDQLPSGGDSAVDWSFGNATSAFDATQVNNLKITVTTGTGVDAPKSGNPLKVQWVSSSDFGLLGTFSAGGGTQVFELPKEANVKDLRIFYSVSSDGTNSYAEYTNEYLVGKSVFSGTMNSTDSSGAMSMLRLGNPPSPVPPNYPTSESVKLLFGGVWWVDALSNGNPRGYQAPSGDPITDQDRLAIWNQVFSLYGSFANRGSNLYTITATNFQRRTPMNVFVSLDSPEASAFIRTDPTMQGLSVEERKKKLEDMLDASNEYLLKQLGITGSSARPSDVTMPGSWEQAATYGGKEAEDRKRIRDALNNPNDAFFQAPRPQSGEPGKRRGGGDTWIPLASKQGNQDTQIARIHDGPNDSPDKVQFPGRNSKPGPGHNPQTQPVRNASNRRRQPVVTHKAHYEPEGEVLSEKKRLKSVKDTTSKIPGYYDGKPAPLGFPMQEPPKMVNGKHPDLVDGKKIANRFNRLDPASAKAMPPTGNQHIDKKVRAAAKKPK